jgi:lipopolysaccharide transport system permease protein
LPTTTDRDSSRPAHDDPSAALVPLAPAGPPRPALRAFVRLVAHLTRHRLAATHHLTVLGWAWPVARQLVQLAVLVFLFSRVFDLGIPDFPVFVFIGLLAWSWLSFGLTAAASSLIDQRHLVNQPRLANATLPMVAIAVPFVDVLVGVPILLVLLVASGNLGIAALACVPIALVQLALIAGLAWLVAAVSVLFRDVPTLIGVLLGVLFYLTPVFYGLRTVPEQFQWVLHVNPMTTLIEAYRAALLGTPAPSAGALAAVAAGSAVVAVGGWRLFRRLELNFADHL